MSAARKGAASARHLFTAVLLSACSLAAFVWVRYGKGPEWLSARQADILRLYAAASKTPRAHLKPGSEGFTLRPKFSTLRIAVASLTSGVKVPPYVAQTMTNHAMYATKHGYAFALYPHIDEKRPPAWSKVLALKRLITSGHHDWILWMDTDTLVMNFNTRVESVLPAESAIDVVVSRDCNGINLGVFLLRASESSLRLLEEMYHGQHVNNESIHHRWWENLSFISLYEGSEEVQNRTLVVHQKELNAYGAGTHCADDWSEGDFIVHFPGTDEETRERLVDEYLGKILMS